MEDWNWTDKESTVIAQVQAVAVYVNKFGEIVIRQQDSMGAEDAVIIVPRAHAAALAKAIKDVAKQPF